MVDLENNQPVSGLRSVEVVEELTPPQDVEILISEFRESASLRSHSVLRTPAGVFAMRVDFHLDGVDDVPCQEKRDETSVRSTNDLTTAVSSAASAKLPERALWLLVGYGLARFNLRMWARDFWIQACGAEHKGLFLSVVTLILTLYMVCIFAPMNAVAEWDTRWRRGSSSGRRAPGVTRAR